ncbi:hypothetical protein QE152_g7128 [Popillia japonica]|uniref:Uncharacterized protein n=1 Tax=Popillia japonica TaxID=7064 RepID=A0AAW1MGB4_POPJA
MYVAESLTLNKAEEEMLKIWKRGILRGILGPVEEEEGKPNLKNHEIQEINDGSDIVKFVKSQRLKWWGHIPRMEENKIPEEYENKSNEGNLEDTNSESDEEDIVTSVHDFNTEKAANLETEDKDGHVVREKWNKM